VLALAATASDTLVVVAYGAFNVANTYTQAEADARYPLNTSSLFAGKNKLINADFGVWQRGTTTTTNYGFVSDRWQYYNAGAGAVSTMSQQAFTPGNTIAGYEPQFFLRMNQTTAGTGATNNSIFQYIEDVRTFAGQTVTLSFWAKAASGTPNITPQFIQNFGTGGSSAVVLNGTAIPITTSWARYSQVVSVPSISGKTVGTSSNLSVGVVFPFNVVQTIDTWGYQVEAGTVATAFQTATGTIQGELAACQRYYYKWVDGLGFSGVGASMGIGANYNATQMNLTCSFPVTMRANPTLVATTGSAYYKFERNGAQDDFNSLTIFHAGVSQAMLYNATEISGTAGQAGSVSTQNASAIVAFSAEL
jgi:hypothetical protein